jgi:hypothetical protein
LAIDLVARGMLRVGVGVCGASFRCAAKGEAAFGGTRKLSGDEGTDGRLVKVTRYGRVKPGFTKVLKRY